MGQQIGINLESTELKEITVGYDYNYRRSTIKSCFVDGVELFLISEVIEFLSRQKEPNKNVGDRIRGQGVSFLLNKWEMRKGGFFLNSAVRTFTNKQGLVLIIESLPKYDIEKAKWMDENIILIETKVPVFIKRQLDYKLLNIEDLNFDKVYQRKVSVSKVRNIVRQFDVGVIGALIVSKREDGYYVIDGQHRIEAMKLLNIKSIMCVVHENLSISEEARLFKKCNNTRKQPSAIDNFRADIIANNKDVLLINNVVEEIGYIINLNGTKLDSVVKPHIKAVSSLMKVFKESGIEGLKDTLSILFETEKMAPTHTEIAGMGIFIRKYKNRYNTKTLISKLKKISAVEMISKSRQMTEIMGGHLTTNYAKYVLKIYNNGKSDKLADEF